MDSMNDLDRELARALQLDPAPDFAARIRAEIAAQPEPSRWHVPALALSAIGCAALAVLGANLWLQVPEQPVPGRVSVLPHQGRAVLAPLRAAVGASPARTASTRPPRGVASEVLVSKSEMLALRRLFTGEVVAPPLGTVADELSIPPLAIEAISLPTILEGEKQ